MVGHLGSVTLLLRMQWSRRHKNCRIGGLMFDSIYLTPNSLFQDLAKEILYLFKYLSSEKGFYQQTDLIIMYCTTSLANWQLLQHGMGSQALGKASERASILVFPFWRRQQSYNVFSDMISIPAYYNSGVENYPSPSMSCCFDDI